MDDKTIIKMKAKFITAPQPLVTSDKKDKIYVFLAGPIQGAPEWQNTVPQDLDVVYLNPRREKDPNFDYTEQIKWETEALRIADIILFWIPQEASEIPGRSYAQTSRHELAEWLTMKDKSLIVGIHEQFPGRRYIEARYSDQIKLRSTFEEVCEDLRDWVKEESTRKAKVFFTSDTHFGSDRALVYSKRPFKDTYEMDWTMISRWNGRVRPGDVVYHLGDFGNRDMLKYLNGDVYFILGNYERDEQKNGELDFVDFFNSLLESGFKSICAEEKEIKLQSLPETIILVHEPSKIDNEFGLFGHIHGRQLVKRRGLDVGVDGHGFRPVSEEEIKFWYEAIKKHYDSEVFD